MARPELECDFDKSETPYKVQLCRSLAAGALRTWTVFDGEIFTPRCDFHIGIYKRSFRYRPGDVVELDEFVAEQIMKQRGRGTVWVIIAHQQNARVIGPFPTEEAAHDYAITNGFRHGDYIVVPIEPVEGNPS